MPLTSTMRGGFNLQMTRTSDSANLPFAPLSTIATVEEDMTLLTQYWIYNTLIER